MTLSSWDWALIGAYFLLILIVGLTSMRKAGGSAKEFFLSGRNMPWWLLGISMVATTFSADTPNLVTNIVRENGVVGNWAWWAFLLTGMLTVFVYARLWRRADLMTDLGFYELRYSGKEASFLRGFRAIYLGVFFNIIIMATVCLAAIKIGSAMLGLSATFTVVAISLITVIYSSLGGLRGILLTDFIQFVLAMIGSIWAMFVVLDLPETSDLQTVLSHPDVIGKLSLIPQAGDRDAWIALFILPLAVQWWSVWYPGAEPGGGGYIAQRMLSAKNETHAIRATFLFNATHYALRPWPWILIALASLIIFPMRISGGGEETIHMSVQAEAFLAENVTDQQVKSLEELLKNKKAASTDSAEQANYGRLLSLVSTYPQHPEIRSFAYLEDALSGSEGGTRTWKDPLEVEQLVRLHLANPELAPNKLGQDLAYPAMLTFLPTGLIGLVLASLLAAVMSTLSTHLNWGASYVVSDVYQRFMRPEATDSQLVAVGRMATVGLMLFAALFALLLSDALQSFNILLQIGAGTGLIFILRWFWWRINAWSEISGMIISFALAIILQIIIPNYTDWNLSDGDRLLWGVGLTTLGWISVTLLTRPTDEETLRSFYRRIQPTGPGWNIVRIRAHEAGIDLPSEAGKGALPMQILAMVLGTLAVYGVLFATGFWIYGDVVPAFAATLLTLGAILALVGVWQRIKR